MYLKYSSMILEQMYLGTFHHCIEDTHKTTVDHFKSRDSEAEHSLAFFSSVLYTEHCSACSGVILLPEQCRIRQEGNRMWSRSPSLTFWFQILGVIKSKVNKSVYAEIFCSLGQLSKCQIIKEELKGPRLIFPILKKTL